MSIRGIVKKIFPEEYWPYLQIPYRMCWAVRRKTIRAFTSRKIIAEAKKYIPYYQDDLSLAILNDRIESLTSQDENIFIRRAKAEGWKFSELYGIQLSKYSCITIVCGRGRKDEQYLRSALELLASPPVYKFITLKDFLGGYRPDDSELLVFSVSDLEFIRASKYIGQKGITNDVRRDLLAMREECQYVDVFRPVQDEVIVDAGAYIGDTALRFVNYTRGGGYAGYIPSSLTPKTQQNIART
ncbi:MAG: hypothetical protein IJR85_04960 [Synergistaceae bacterium]|nr:hypothetical protein [Synergistaceae bacterium]